MSFLNPGREIRETEKHQHARTRRNTFGQKARDTFFVFFGSFGLANRERSTYSSSGKSKNHFGVFDYFTLGILYLLNAISLALVMEVNFLPLKIVGAVFSAIFAIPRAIFAGVFTFLSLPFIGIVHGAVSGKADKIKEIINNHEQIVDPAKPKDKTSVGALFKFRRMQIEEIERVDKVINHEQGKPLGTMDLTFHQGAAKLTVQLNVDKNNKIVIKNQSKFFKALTRLNVGDLQFQIEQEEAKAKNTV